MPEVAKETLNLDELKALCAAATPGPWVAQVLGSDGYMVNRVLPDDADLREKMRRGVLKVNWLDWDSDKANAEFVAASRSAVPSLISEVERLRAQRDEARADLYGLLGAIDGFRDCCAGGSEIGERELLDLRRDLVRVLSRTEDGTNG